MRILIFILLFSPFFGIAQKTDVFVRLTDAKGQQMARKGDVTAAMTFIQGGKVDHGRPRPWSLAPPELTLIMRNSAWVALICVSGTDGHRSPQQLHRHQKNSPGQDGGAGARKPL